MTYSTDITTLRGRMLAETAERGAELTTYCKPLQQTRLPFIAKLKELMFPDVLPECEDELVKLVLDPSHIIHTDCLEPFEDLSNGYCYAMHHHRSLLLGHPPTHKNSTKTNILKPYRPHPGSSTQRRNI